MHIQELKQCLKKSYYFSTGQDATFTNPVVEFLIQYLLLS